MEVVGDLDLVNARIENSPRPELVISERAEMMAVPTLNELFKINNFAPNMKSFGMPLYVAEENPINPDRLGQRLIGYRDFTDEERELLFVLGGRSFQEIEDITEELEVDKDLKRAAQVMTNACREAFIRMWILFPELTEKLMTSCLDRPDQGYVTKDEEIFIAYNVMARLVDTNDRGVTKDDGSIDNWRLCR